MEAIHATFVPGVGDHHPITRKAQQLALASWSLSGVKVSYFTSHWNGHESYEHKEERLTDFLTCQYEKYGPLALILSSAGKAAGINAFARNPEMISRVAAVNGLTHNQYRLNPKYFETYPSYRAALDKLPSSLESLGHERRGDILNYDSWHDGVTHRNTYIFGAEEARNLIPGHAAGIAWALTLGRQPIINFFEEANRH